MEYSFFSFFFLKIKCHVIFEQLKISPNTQTFCATFLPAKSAAVVLSGEMKM